LEVGITYNRMLCNDFTGPARFRLIMPEVALELKRVGHPWFKALYYSFRRWVSSVPYLRKVAPMAKFKCAPYPI